MDVIKVGRVLKMKNHAHIPLIVRRVGFAFHPAGEDEARHVEIPTTDQDVGARTGPASPGAVSR